MLANKTIINQKLGHKIKHIENMKYSLGNVSIYKVSLDFPFFALVCLKCDVFVFDEK